MVERRPNPEQERRSIAARVFAASRTAAEQSVRANEGSAVQFHHRAKVMLSEIDARQGDVAKISERAQRYELLGELGEFSALPLYVKAFNHADPSAKAHIEDMLEEERTRPDDDPREKNGPTKLSALVQACVDEGVAPDLWISEYAKTDDDAAELRLLYAHNARIGAKDPKAQRYGHIYQNMVTSAFLRDRVFTDNVRAWRNAGSLWRNQIDPVTKRLLFQKFKELSPQVNAENGDLRIYPESFYQQFKNSVNFYAETLEQEGDGQYVDMDWMKGYVNAGLETFRKLGYSVDQLKEDSFDFQMNLLVQQHAPVTDVVRTIDEQPQSLTRDTILHNTAMTYAARGEFAKARALVMIIGDETIRVNAMQDCFESVRTPKEVADMRPTDFSYDFDEPLRVAYDQQSNLRSTDPNVVGKIALDSLAVIGRPIEPETENTTSHTESDAENKALETEYAAKKRMEKSLRAVYALDRDSGHALANRLISHFQQRAHEAAAPAFADTFRLQVVDLARIKVEQGDMQSLETMLDTIGQFQPETSLIGKTATEYASLARLAQQQMEIQQQQSQQHEKIPPLLGRERTIEEINSERRKGRDDRGGQEHTK
jgi:hypothetical protein